MDMPVIASGCGVRVAVTTTVSGKSDAYPGASTATKAAEEKKTDFLMTFSWFEPRAGTRQRRSCFAKQDIANTKDSRGDDSTLSSRRFPPQLPAHPGRKQDDGVGQVSWLPGLRFPSAFPKLSLQWHLDVRSPVTVAGAAAVSHRVP